jgi:hypothetical protein
MRRREFILALGGANAVGPHPWWRNRAEMSGGAA